MGGTWQTQTSFTRGELEPRLVGRVDLESYYSGAATLTNVLAIPQGGVTKRPGMEFIAEALDNGRMEAFEFSTEETYLVVFSPLRMEIFKDAILQTNINGSGNDYLVTTLTAPQIAEMDYIQSADSIIITHEDIEPILIQRTSDTDWTLGTVPLINIPEFNFNDVSSPAPVTEIQELDFSPDWQNGDTFKLSLEGILTEDITFNENDLIDTAKQIQLELQSLPNTGGTGIAAFVSNEPSEILRVHFAGDSAKDWNLLTTLPIAGLGDLSNNTVVLTRIQTGSSASEPVWSNARGWPRTATFHESRLWFGGSKSRPSTIWSSNANQPFNFSVGRARDDESISSTLATDQVNAVTGIISNRSLQIFTTGAEFTVEASPVTPENISVKPQTNLGSKRVRPIVLEGTTIFIQRTGKALFQFQFINEFQSNEARSVSILSPQLINDPTQMAVRRGSATSDANYIYIVGDNGNLTVFNSNTLEGVQAFTRWQTAGDIVSVAVVENKVYTLTRRTINSSVVYQIGRENDLLNTDAGVIEAVGGSDTLTGLTHLEGETVEVKADGAVQDDEIVTAGQITINRTADTIEAGLKFRPTVKTMPLNQNLNNGPNAAQKKRIARAAIEQFESNGVTINGQLLADKTIALNQFDAPEPQAGLKRIYMHGWSLAADVTITQITPMPFTLLSLILEVKV